MALPSDAGLGWADGEVGDPDGGSRRPRPRRDAGSIDPETDAGDTSVDAGSPDGVTDAGAHMEPDAGPADAGPACDPTSCPLGCCGDRCCAIAPSNGSDVGDLAITGLVIEPPAGMFDTDAQCVSSSPLGRCAPVALATGAEACVCRSDQLRIAGSLRVTGTRALVILAWESVMIAGDLDVGGRGSIDGPGASASYASIASWLSAGAGGSFGTVGGGAPSAASFGDATLVPLEAGMRGQDACGTPGTGGGAGGAVQITAGGLVEITGSIRAGGGGGAGGAYECGGAGGGSGGAILLEARTVRVSGVVAANGGAGGGGGSSNGYGGRGGDASLGTSVAAGGSGGAACGCALFGYLRGGSGGGGAALGSEASSGGASSSDGRCLGATCHGGQGGGGGGVGRVHVRTRTGCACGGTFSPAPTFGDVALH